MARGVGARAARSAVGARRRGPAHGRERGGAGPPGRLPRGRRAVQDRVGKESRHRLDAAETPSARAETLGGMTRMADPRIQPLTPDDAPAEVRPIFETYLQERGNIPNMFRTVALRPNHLRTLIAHFRTVMNEGTVPPLLKELLWVRISHLNRCRY